MQVRNLSQATFDELRGRLMASHDALVTSVPKDANAGYISGHGVQAAYRYDAAAQTLDVTIEKHPFWINSQAIQETLRQRIAECQKVAEGTAAKTA